MGTYHRESRLIVNNEEGVLVCAPCNKGNFFESVVWDVILNRTERLCEILTYVTSDVCAFTQTGGVKELCFYSADTPLVASWMCFPSNRTVTRTNWVRSNSCTENGKYREGASIVFCFAGRGALTMMKSIQRDAKCSPCCGEVGVCIVTND
jgi:hypothetical protein